MILVTGGCFQGKTDYACETFHIAKEEAADGMDCPMEAIYETKLLYHFHEYIKRCMEANQELDLEELERPLADAHTLLPEKHRPGRVQLDGNSQKQQQPRKAQNAAGRQQNIQQPFDPIPIHKSNFLRFLRVYRLIIAVWAAFFNCRLYPAGDICRFWSEQGVLPLVFYLISRYNRQLLCSHKAYYRR